MRAFITSASFLLLFCALCPWMQVAEALPLASGRITGIVIDQTTGDPLPGATVMIKGTGIGAATDIDGNFSIPNAPAGAQTLSVTYVGYETLEMPVQVPDGGTVNVRIEMNPETLQGEEVVVTAQAAGQRSAINQQLANNTISNIVSADRIQELPDVNAAESIGRLPGVAIQRSGGEATKVSIRGLSPSMNAVTVNGVRMPSTSGDDRSVDLSLISPNMLDGIEVRKAITPDQDADAIAGSVDLKLRQADPGFKVDLLAQGGFNEMQRYYGNYKFVGTVSNRFFGNRLGLIVSGTKDSYDRSADKLSAGYARGAPQNPDSPSDSTIIWLTSVNTREENVTRGRTGGSLVADFRIPLGRITANGFYNQLSSDGLYRIQDYNRQSGQHAYWDTESRHNATSLLTGAFGLEQDFSFLRYDATVSRTASRSRNPEDFLWRFGREDARSFSIPDSIFSEDLTPDVFAFSVQAKDTLGLNHILVQSTNLDENETSALLNIQVPFRLGTNFTGYFKTGGKLRWLGRANDQEQHGRGGLQYGSGAGNLNEPLECIAEQLPDWNLDEIVGAAGVLPIKLVLDDYSRDNFLGGDYQFALAAQEAKLKELARALQACPEETYNRQSIESLGRDYDGIERYQAAYAMAEFNFGRLITFMPGFRFEADYSRYHGQRFRAINSAGRESPPADLTPLTVIRKNSFFLPMVHLQVKPAKWVDVRLAYTESLKRPDYIQYAPITSIDIFRSSVRANNASLRPAHARNYDASVSFHENRLGLFTVSGFRKSIDDLVMPVGFTLNSDTTFSRMFQQRFSGTSVPVSWYQGAAPWLSTYDNNPFETTYKGFELDWQTNFWYLPSVFKGLVFNANYTFISSSTTYQGYYTRQGERIPNTRPARFKQILDDTLSIARMPDQPAHIANVTLGYDLKGFSTRLSFLFQTNRSTFVDPLVSILSGYSGDYFRVDLSARQKLGSGLEIFANLNNLNARPDENFRQSPTATNRPSYLEYYGFTMNLGARYRF